MQSFPVRRLLPIPSAHRQKLRAVSSTDAGLCTHETTLFRYICLLLCHIVAFRMFKVNDSHEIVGNFCKSAQKTVFSSFGRKKRTDPSCVRIHELGSVFHHFIFRTIFFGAAMPPGCLPHLSHLSQRALIWSANLARSLLAPPSLCSMTRSRRLPALSRRWKTVAARAAPSLTWCSMRIRVPSFRQTAPSAPMAHCSPL